jgi:hypothetical protein
MAVRSPEGAPPWHRLRFSPGVRLIGAGRSSQLGWDERPISSEQRPADREPLLRGGVPTCRPESGGTGPYLFGVGLVAVLALLLFGRMLPEVARPARAGWILAGLALASCVVFWSGLPFALGFGAAYCGARAGRAGPVVAGLLAVTAAVAGCIVG